MSLYLFVTTYLGHLNRILSIVQHEEAFDKKRLNYQGRDARFRHALRKEKRLVQIAKDHKWTAEDMSMAEMLIDMPGPL
jgi:acyl-CoA oxidase